jgi:hypothetical protein
MGMSFMSAIRQLFASRRWRLKECETQVIAALLAAIPSTTRAILELQLQRIAFVQRHAADKEVNFYYDAPPGEGDEPTIVSRFESWPICICYLATADGFPPRRATIWIVSGKLFSIIFSFVPSNTAYSVVETILLAGRGEDELAWGIEELEVLPSTRSIVDVMPRVDNSSIMPPLSPALRAIFLKPCELCLPADFVELLEYTNGFCIGRWRVHGLPLEEVAMDGPNLFVLARSDGAQLLCASDGDYRRKVYLWDIESFQSQSFGSSFIDLLNSHA